MCDPPKSGCTVVRRRPKPIAVFNNKRSRYLCDSAMIRHAARPVGGELTATRQLHLELLLVQRKRHVSKELLSFHLPFYFLSAGTLAVPRRLTCDGSLLKSRSISSYQTR